MHLASGLINSIGLALLDFELAISLELTQLDCGLSIIALGLKLSDCKLTTSLAPMGSSSRLKSLELTLIIIGFTISVALMLLCLGLSLFSKPLVSSFVGPGATSILSMLVGVGTDDTSEGTVAVPPLDSSSDSLLGRLAWHCMIR
ncbi:hypothetical protein C0J52_24205 [Blattella germanica]|nr:hypothetical protein C0J52_24205 [Blattella germanica]